MKTTLFFLLLSFSASIFAATNSKAYDSMMSAIEANDVPKVKALLAKKINPNTRVDTRASPTFLTHAAYRGRIDIMKLLIAAGADLEMPNGDGYTPLMMAAWGGHLEAVRFLLAQRADINAVAFRGETALSLAAEFKKTDIVSALKKAGAKQ